MSMSCVDPASCLATTTCTLNVEDAYGNGVDVGTDPSQIIVRELSKMNECIH